MRFQAREYLCANALVAVAVLSGTAAAVCTKWEHDSIRVETGANYALGDHSVSLESLDCPAGAGDPCRFEGNPHRVVAEPEVRDGRFDPLPLSSDEERSAIIRLGQDAYNAEVGGPRRSDVEFKTLAETIHPFADLDDALRTVPPGSKGSLYWDSYYRYSTGVLGGCTNASLNRINVTVGAPYAEPDRTKNNATGIAGHLSRGVAHHKDNDSGVSRLGQGSGSGAILGSSLVVLVLSFMLLSVT